MTACFVVMPQLFRDIELCRDPGWAVDLAQGLQFVLVDLIGSISHIRENFMTIWAKSQSRLYTRNNPRLTEFAVNSGFTRMSNPTFGEHLRRQLDEKGMRPAELARRSGVTKQNIGRLLNNTPHPITGKAPSVERETVEKLANALGWHIDDALLAAGYSPQAPEERHRLPEGVTVYFDSSSDLSDEQKDKILDVINMIVAGVRAGE